MLAFSNPVDWHYCAYSESLSLFAHVLRLGSTDAVYTRLPHCLPYGILILVIIAGLLKREKYESSEFTFTGVISTKLICMSASTTPSESNYLIPHLGEIVCTNT